MTLIGYTMMGEQAGPKQLVRDVALTEEAGFDFAVISDHYFPWPDSQGHSRTRGACSVRPPTSCGRSSHLRPPRALRERLHRALWNHRRRGAPL